MKTYRENHKKEKAVYDKAYRESHRKEQEAYREAHKEEAKNTNLKWHHGITLEQHNQMYKEQNGLCAICYRKMIGKNCHVDHNHVTGKIRGLLCNGCNVGLGHFCDGPDMLNRAVGYLRGW
jgi:hypothetical protein